MAINFTNLASYTDLDIQCHVCYCALCPSLQLQLLPSLAVRLNKTHDKSILLN
jgi:hypothetical protein